MLKGGATTRPVSYARIMRQISHAFPRDNACSIPPLPPVSSHAYLPRLIGLRTTPDHRDCRDCGNPRVNLHLSLQSFYKISNCIHHCIYFIEHLHILIRRNFRKKILEIFYQFFYAAIDAFNSLNCLIYRSQVFGVNAIRIDITADMLFSVLRRFLKKLAVKNTKLFKSLIAFLESCIRMRSCHIFTFYKSIRYLKNIR